MKAIELKAPFQVQMVTRKFPQRGPGEALLKIRAVSICGSDVNAYRGKNRLVQYPVIIGHEITGEIVEIDEDNPKGLKKGQLVQVDPYIYCGECYPCSIGRTNCCNHLRVIGVHQDGGMSEYFVHPVHLLYASPRNVPLQLLPLAEPLCIALHGLNRLRVRQGETVAIFGAGPIGLLAALAAKEKGACPILTDILPSRLAYANQIGISHTILSSEPDAVQKIKKAAGGECMCCLEASGATSAIKMCLEAVSHAGRIALTGWPSQKILMDSGVITKKELDIRGARTAVEEFPEALSLMESGRVDVSLILTEAVPFYQIPQAIQWMANTPEKYLKIVCVME